MSYPRSEIGRIYRGVDAQGHLIMTDAYRKQVEHFYRAGSRGFAKDAAISTSLALSEKDQARGRRGSGLDSDDDDFVDDSISMDEDEYTAMLQKQFDERRGAYAGQGHVEIPADPRLNDLVENAQRTQEFGDASTQHLFDAARARAQKAAR